MATKKKRGPAAASQSKSWTLYAPPLPPGVTVDAYMASAAAGGVVGNARTLAVFGHNTFGELSLTECAAALTATADGLNGGDLAATVTMLSSQAIALNAMFGELARRAALNLGEYMEASETYLRLALKAQGQCRATLETLAAIKNPPVVIARQANINHGGQQQVNNGATSGGGGSDSNRVRAEIPQNAPNKLLIGGVADEIESCPVTRAAGDLLAVGRAGKN